MKLVAKRTLLPLLAVALLIGVGIFAHLALASGGEKAAAPSKAYAAATYAPVEDAITTEIPFVDAPNIFYWTLKEDPNYGTPDFKGYTAPSSDSLSSRASDMLEMSLLRKHNFDYVDYFGGAFHAYDKDIYYVYLTDLTKVPELNKALGEYAEGVIFLPAKYGYNELYDIADRMQAELLAEGICVSAFGVDVYYNKQQVIIYVLPDYLDAAQEYINNNHPHPELFELGEMGYMIPCSGSTDASEAEAISLEDNNDRSDSAALKAAELLRMLAVYTL